MSAGTCPHPDVVCERRAFAAPPALSRRRERAAIPRATAEYLHEQPSRYSVGGAHMGLSEGRRTAAVREVEATFRMAPLHRLCAD